MADHTFFQSQPDDSGDPSASFEQRFACHRRFVDLSHIVDLEDETDVDNEPSDAPMESALAHPEIIEFIESLLVADPTIQAGSEIQPSERAHAVYVPEYYEAGYAYPLIVWFHGDGASETELAEVMPVISERNYVGVSIRGDIPSGSGYAWSPEASPELLNDVKQIVTSLRREYHIHSERIYLAGFKSGATTAIQLMLQKPEWFGGVISFSGDVPTMQTTEGREEDLRDKRILLAMSLGSKTSRVGDVVAAGRVLYSAGMKVGTRIYQDTASSPTPRMLRDLDSWLMDDICSSVRV